jgi:hypothetical protein
MLFPNELLFHSLILVLQCWGADLVNSHFLVFLYKFTSVLLAALQTFLIIGNLILAHLSLESVYLSFHFIHYFVSFWNISNSWLSFLKFWFIKLDNILLLSFYWNLAETIKKYSYSCTFKHILKMFKVFQVLWAFDRASSNRSKTFGVKVISYILSQYILSPIQYFLGRTPTLLVNF